jgi:hypothetical protein
MAIDQDVRAEGAIDSIDVSSNDRAPAAKSNVSGAQQQQLHKPPVLLFFLPLVLIIIYAIFSR